MLLCSTHCNIWKNNSQCDVGISASQCNIKKCSSHCDDKMMCETMWQHAYPHPYMFDTLWHLEMFVTLLCLYIFVTLWRHDMYITLQCEEMFIILQWQGDVGHIATYAYVHYIVMLLSTLRRHAYVCHIMKLLCLIDCNVPMFTTLQCYMFIALWH